MAVVVNVNEFRAGKNDHIKENDQKIKFKIKISRNGKASTKISEKIKQNRHKFDMFMI